MINDKQRKNDGVYRVYRCVPQKTPTIQYYSTGDPLVVDWFQGKNYIVFHYEDDEYTIVDEIYFTDIDKAIEFAKLNSWDWVIDKNTNEILYYKR